MATSVLPEEGFHLQLTVETEMEDLSSRRRLLRAFLDIMGSQHRSDVASLANSW